ncbi:MAG: BLUF domain-containing protein, partial [Bacteroidales bacterium]
FKAIEQDTRHTNVVKLLEESIEKRAFPDWSMGFRRISKKQTSRIPGFSDFLTAETPEKLISGSTEQVMYLLDSFRKYT